MKYFLLAMLLVCSGCTVNLGQRMVFVHDKYPVYEELVVPELKDVQPRQMTPYKPVVNLLQDIYADGTVSDEEATAFNQCLIQAKQNEQEAVKVISQNMEALHKWGRLNALTVKHYNAFAREMNTRKDEP